MLLVDDLAAGGTKNLRHTPRGLVTLITLLWIFLELFSLIICSVISCLLFNLITVRGFSMKLHTFVKHIQTMCLAQEP